MGGLESFHPDIGVSEHEESVTCAKMTRIGCLLEGLRTHWALPIDVVANTVAQESEWLR